MKVKIILNKVYSFNWEKYPKKEQVKKHYIYQERGKKLFICEILKKFFQATRQKTKMNIDIYWNQFAQLNKNVYIIGGTLYGLSEFIGFGLILCNIIYLLR